MDAAHSSEEGSEVEWRGLIEAAAGSRPEPVVAETYYRRWKTASGAVELGCSDGNIYVVKGLRNDQEQGRMMFNDQVTARLGALIAAPVPDVGLVQVSAELIAANPDPKEQMGHMKPCTAHGSLRIDDVTERVNALDHGDDNRERFASLAMLFGWLLAGDRQFIYKKSPPHLVYSHDHGHFFPGGPNWTVSNLQKAGPATAEQALVNHFKFKADELGRAYAPLGDLTPEMLAAALAAPPQDWGVTLDERVVLAEYLERRRAELAGAHL
ncbi:MAG: hypothetical protein IIA34_14560, partial [Proteobacteria bacterium]|nr:hypothetical protein [Pseudomonadota bacterium]